MGPHRHPGITASVFAILIYIYTRKYGVAHGTLPTRGKHRPNVAIALRAATDSETRALPGGTRGITASVFAILIYI